MTRYDLITTPKIGEEVIDLATVDVQRDLPATLSDTWELIVSCPELWLGDTVRVENHGVYAVDGCLDSGHVHGCILEVVLLERVGLTWQPDGWDEPAVVEIAIAESDPSHTRVTAYVEGVPAHAARAEVDAHWSAALDRLVATPAVTEVSAASAKPHAA